MLLQDMNLPSYIQALKNVEITSVEGGDHKFDKTWGKIRTFLTLDEITNSGWLDYRRDRKATDGINSPDWVKPGLLKEFTYSGCCPWEYDIEKNILTVTMYDGDSMSGKLCRTQKRCFWEFTPSLSSPIFEEMLLDYFNSALRCAALRQRDIELARIESEAIDAIYAGFFGPNT